MSTPPGHRDAAALPLLVAVMGAAGRHDTPTCQRLLDEAEATLGAGRHKSRPDIAAARNASAGGDWPAVWRHAWAATTGLTWAFAPDPSTCPPCPGPEPYTEGAVCCGTDLPAASRFCPLCGAAV